MSHGAMNLLHGMKPLPDKLAAQLAAQQCRWTATQAQKPSPALLLQVEAAAGADPAQHEGLMHSSLAAAFQAAHAWQASTLQRQGSGTGACLCSNFLLIADCVMEQDAHLISHKERELLQTFKASPAQVQAAI